MPTMSAPRPSSTGYDGGPYVESHTRRSVVIRCGYRVEMDSDWYVIFRNTSFYLPENKVLDSSEIDGVYRELVQWTSPSGSQLPAGCLFMETGG